MTRNFMELLASQQSMGNFVCVGLDSDPKRIPSAYSQLAFNQRLVEATADFAGAYKPNLAFYPGPDGKKALMATIEFIWTHAPGVPVILDAKQGDIGSTNDGYIVDDFNYYGADAVTMHNYMGMEAMRPFLNQADKGVIVLVRTSNPGAGEFQDVECVVMHHKPTDRVFSTIAEAERELGEAMPVGGWQQIRMRHYQFVARRVFQAWNFNGNVCAVVGATVPAELSEVRAIVGNMPILLPGIGAQGGDLEATVNAGRNSQGQGMIINNSRGIIFAYEKEDLPNPDQFGVYARQAGIAMHNAIRAQLGLQPFGD